MDKIVILSKHHEVNNLFDYATKAAQFPVNILIKGESGTGKEIIAKYIFDKQQELTDNKGNFVDINCSALPSELLESELFGHRKGSFTGAYSNKDGLFLIATDGAIFLDEVGDMPLLLQAKLLRCLETHTIRPVGATKPKKFNTRVISATNQNIQELIDNKKFRLDLLYRLNGVTLKTIPLRSRIKDIPTLFDNILQQTITKFKINVETISVPNEVIEVLSNYQWPGNIRELKNVVEALTVLSYHENNLLLSKTTLVDILEGGSNSLCRTDKVFTWSVDDNGPNLKQAVNELETYIIKDLMNKYGSVYKAASAAGIAYITARKKL